MVCLWNVARILYKGLILQKQIQYNFDNPDRYSFESRRIREFSLESFIEVHTFLTT
jgi:hypothetical protein